MQLYRPLNIRVVLVDVITWNTGNQISVVQDPETLLDNFELYVPNISSSYDSTMLITYVIYGYITTSTVGTVSLLATTVHTIQNTNNMYEPGIFVNVVVIQTRFLPP